jgi:membrane protein implicated in regulation of membrane protease activity
MKINPLLWLLGDFLLIIFLAWATMATNGFLITIVIALALVAISVLLIYKLFQNQKLKKKYNREDEIR